MDQKEAEALTADLKRQLEQAKEDWNRIFDHADVLKRTYEHYRAEIERDDMRLARMKA